MFYLQLSNFKDKGILPLLQMYRLFRQKTDLIKMCQVY